MSRTIEERIAELPRERRAKIRRRIKELIEEELSMASFDKTRKRYGRALANLAKR